jgi:hypothetical protein
MKTDLSDNTDQGISTTVEKIEEMDGGPLERQFEDPQSTFVLPMSPPLQPTQNPPFDFSNASTIEYQPTHDSIENDSNMTPNTTPEQSISSQGITFFFLFWI